MSDSDDENYERVDQTDDESDGSDENYERVDQSDDENYDGDDENFEKSTRMTTTMRVTVMIKITKGLSRVTTATMRGQR